MQTMGLLLLPMPSSSFCPLISFVALVLIFCLFLSGCGVRDILAILLLDFCFSCCFPGGEVPLVLLLLVLI